jgi:hypothetical protein
MGWSWMARAGRCGRRQRERGQPGAHAPADGDDSNGHAHPDERKGGHPCRSLDIARPAPYTGWVRPLLALTVLLLAAPDLRAAVEVRVSGQRVDVQAVNAPLSEILDGLARELKVKIVYEGPPPRQLLSVDLKGRTPAEAFLSIVEGQGLSYALALDKTGRRVESVLMAGGNNAPSVKAGAPPPPSRPERMPREAVVEEPTEEAAEADEEQLPPDTARPVVPHAKPAEAPPPPTQGVYIPAPSADYPSSVFAPKPPAPEPNKPKPESTPPPFNP